MLILSSCSVLTVKDTQFTPLQQLRGCYMAPECEISSTEEACRNADEVWQSGDAEYWIEQCNNTKLEVLDAPVKYDDAQADLKAIQAIGAWGRPLCSCGCSWHCQGLMRTAGCLQTVATPWLQLVYQHCSQLPYAMHLELHVVQGIQPTPARFGAYLPDAASQLDFGCMWPQPMHMITLCMC